MARLIIVDKFDCPMCPKFDAPKIRVLDTRNDGALCICQKCQTLFKVVKHTFRASPSEQEIKIIK